MALCCSAQAARPEAAPYRGPVKVTFLGDVMCQGPMLKAYSTGDGKYDFSEVFAGVKGLLAESDYVFANLETPIAPDNQDLTHERYAFCSPHEFAEAAKAAGIDFVFTANNHCLDRGPAGIPRTVAALDKIGLPHTGTFATAQDAAKPLVVDVKGFRIGVLSYTYGSNAFANHQYLSETNRFMVNLFQEQELSNPLARAWMRNRKSEEGLRYPVQFIPVLERNGMIAVLDRFIWRKACEILARWKREGKSLFLSVNMLSYSLANTPSPSSSRPRFDRLTPSSILIRFCPISCPFMWQFMFFLSSFTYRETRGAFERHRTMSPSLISLTWQFLDMIPSGASSLASISFTSVLARHTTFLGHLYEIGSVKNVVFGYSLTKVNASSDEPANMFMD